MITDKIGDLITRIRNGHSARHTSVKGINTKLNCSILDVLSKEGYIKGYNKKEDRYLDISLKYSDKEQPCIKKIERVSKPGRRVYLQVAKFKPYYKGLGINVISTSKGVMSDYEAIRNNVGGEVLFRVF